MEKKKKTKDEKEEKFPPQLFHTLIFYVDVFALFAVVGMLVYVAWTGRHASNYQEYQTSVAFVGILMTLGFLILFQIKNGMSVRESNKKLAEIHKVLVEIRELLK